MFISQMSLPRRTFLRGVGAALALPFLDAMTPALSAMAANPTPVMRLGFTYVPNGIQLVNWIPKVEGTQFEIPPILNSLAPFRDQMTIVSGLSNKQAEMFDEGGGAHTRPATTWLSGVRPKRTEGADIQAGPTIDQIAAQKLGKDTALTSLELALEPNFLVGNCETGYSCSYMNTFSWRDSQTPVPMETNPRVVFERLFGEGGTGALRVADMRLNRSILDSVRGDISKLERSLGTSDRRMIAAYFESIRDVERRLQRAEEHAQTSPTAMEGPLGIPDSFHEHAELMFDLQYLAYQADLTRVVGFQIARELSTRSYPEAGVAEAHHDVSHHQNNPERMAKNTKINAYHVQLFSRLVEKMHATPDGDGTLLDHSILLYGAGMGDGDQHSAHNLPVVLVGGGCSQLKGGRHIKCALDTPMMNLGVSLLEKVGIEAEHVGDSAGKVNEL
jgi:hypothetical protein